MPSMEHFDCANCPSRIDSPFHELSHDELTKVQNIKSCTFFKKGQIIFHEGNRPGGIYCIRKGKVKLSRLGSDGKEQIIRFGKDSDIIGYRSILSGENLSATATTLEDTSACFVPKKILFDSIEGNPKFSLRIMKEMSRELGEAGKLITNLAQKSVRERLAEVILVLRTTFGETEEGNVDISLTREELANMVGTATESVIRLLSEFKEDQLIELKGRKLKITNPDQLARIGKVFD